MPIRKLQKLINDLLDRAKMEGWLISPTERRHANSRASYQKPGQFITSLPEEERAKLKDVTAEDFNHRIDEVVFTEGRTLGRKGRLGKHLDEDRIQHHHEELKRELNKKV